MYFRPDCYGNLSCDKAGKSQNLIRYARLIDHVNGTIHWVHDYVVSQ